MASTAAPMETGEVDEKLYSRQLYVMGHEAQRRMMASNVVMIGCGGLGVEVAKNGILAGLHSLSLMDPRPANWMDLGANFYLTPDHVKAGKRKDEACAKQLAELNPYVQVSVCPVSEWTLEAMLTLVSAPATPPSCVVVTEVLANDWLYAINDECRKVGCKFLYAVANGLFGRVFADLGDAHVVNDPDGNPPASSQIESVLMENPAVIKTLEDQRHGLETGDVVQFGRLKGLDGVLEAKKDYTVKVTGPYTFELEGVDLSGKDNSGGSTHQGYITQVKQPTTLSFKTYKEKMEDPGEFVLSDFAKFDRPQLLHLGFKALTQYMEQNGGNLPAPADMEAVNKVLEIAATLSEEPLTAAQKRILTFYALGSQAQISPMCAALGGMVGQEVLKACSGKFTPLQGFFYLDADECLPDEVPDLALLKPTGSRYDSQTSVFGIDLQEKLFALRYFLVGAGAIGCEMLKNWALMGVGCGGNGHVSITDMDRIEKSNLSRQFLFRNTDIDQFKSTTAAKACQVMNPDFQVTAYQEKVAPDTEHLFGDDFYDKLSGVCTALDNVDARLYMDQKCVFYQLPMLESGTLGTKGNTQIVVPHVTENYGATRDPPEKSIPVCTLKNFPNMIQHTLQWARDWFEGAFRQSAEEVNSYLSNPQLWLEGIQQNSKVETLQLVRKTLVDDRPVSFEDCVVWARLQFEELFNNSIRQLLYNFPEDQVTSSGAKFWSGSKRCPKALSFSLDDICEDAGMKNHLDFVVAAANLRASMYGIKGRTDEAYFRTALKDVIVPDFTPSDGVKIAANDAEEEKRNEEAMDGGEAEAEEIWKSLPTQSDLAGFRLHPIEFDKDVDDHMLFVTACSNLRALNYSIPTEDTHRSRAIAGRIIPAIATTTALVTGLICFELYKIVGTPRKELTIEAYKNGFINLAIPFMTLSEPTAPAKTKAMLKGKEWEWTAWDCLDMNLGNITMGEFMTHFENEYNLEISMLSYSVSILYSFFANKKKVEERKAMKMTDVITSITKKEFAPNQLFLILEVIANDKETDEEVELPYIRFRFR